MPWYDADCRATRRRSRMLERRYRRTQSDADRLEWIQQLRMMHQLYEGKNSQENKDFANGSKTCYLHEIGCADSESEIKICLGRLDLKL
jgi:hypothetical protein